MIKKIDVKDYEIMNLENNSNDIFPYNIDSIEVINRKLFVEGWLARKGQNNNDIDILVVIKDDKDNYYKIFTKSVTRLGLNEYFNDGYDYTNTGFISKGKLKKEIKYPLKIYFLIKKDGRKVLINTNKILN